MTQDSLDFNQCVWEFRRTRGYVEAAQAMGCRHPRIILSHILPNVTAPILVIASIWLGNAILIEATLSFLVGVDALEHRPRVHGAGAVARDLPRPRHQPGRLGLQPLR
jgi:ABC-type antimicrobial peptide transport system permease subunit